MKKIKLKNIIDVNSNNIDDIYKNIVNEIGLETKQDKNKQKGNEKILNKNKDDDLLLKMTKRLNVVEKELTEAKKQIIEKDKLIAKLNEKIEQAKTENFENSAKLNKIIDRQYEYITKLYTFMNENGILITESVSNPTKQEEIKNKINKLKDDLNQINENYNEIDEEEKEASTDYDKKALPQTIDIKVLSRRIEEMNYLIYEEQGSNYEFENEGGKVFKLKQKKELLISFYKNGLIIEGFQFFPYESENAQKIIQDILDGYSPFILKERYPHGVLMKVENHVKAIYEANKKDNVNDNIKDIHNPGEQKYISKEKFVEIFPKTVIKNGNILNIKEDMEKILGVKKIVKEEDNDQFDLYDINDKNINDKNISKLKIKIVTIDKIININIPLKSHINKLFEFIQNYINDNLSKVSSMMKIRNIEDYGFIINYPFQIISFDKEKNENNTIEKYGLYPSAFITFDVVTKYTKK